MLLLTALAASAAVPSEVRQIFEVAASLSSRDDGRLWRTYLLGPLLVLGTVDGEVWSNRPLDGFAKRGGAIWHGWMDPLPGSATPQIGSERFAVIALPVPTDPLERRRTVARALFRRIESDLGYAVNRPFPDYLSSPSARYWLDLEATALIRAIDAKGADQKRALEDALAFRAWRRVQFRPDSLQERIRELNDGLGEYTALVLTSESKAALDSEVKALLTSVGPKTYATAFAAAYGVLMDRKSKRWRDLIDSQVDLGLVLREVWELSPPLVSREMAERRANSYRIAKAIVP